MQREQRVAREELLGIRALLLDPPQRVHHPGRTRLANVSQECVVGTSVVACRRRDDVEPALRQVSRRHMTQHAAVAGDEDLHMKYSTWPISSSSRPMSSAVVIWRVFADVYSSPSGRPVRRGGSRYSG